jgi:putative tricarboxylic transport membrane protein
MQIKKSVIAIVALAALMVGGTPRSSVAEKSSAAGFFKGKTITWIVPFGTGGNFDFYSRLIAPYFEKFTGAKVLVKNQTGAGGILANNSVYAAKPDGLTLALINAGGSAAGQIAGQKGVRYDLAKFSWLGQVAGKISVIAVRDSVHDIATAKDLIHYQKTLKFGASGPGGGKYIEGLFDQRYLNPHVRIITGYAGDAEVFAALQRGEIDMTSSDASSVYHHIQAGGAKVVLCIGAERTPFFPDIPALPDIKSELSPQGYENLLAQAHLEAVEYEAAAPPGVAADRLAFLREALRKSLQDPDFLAKAKRAKRPIEYLPAEKVEQLIAGIFHSSDEFKEALKAAYKRP